MFKKRNLGLALALGLLALAFTALPAMASAAELTDSEGAVEVGTEIRATSSNAQTVTSVGALTCTSVEVGGEVGTNSGGTVTVLEILGGSEIAEGCERVTPEGSEPATVTPLFKHLHLSAATNTATFAFIAHLFGGAVTCAFEGTVPVTYTSGTSSIHAEGEVTGTSAEPCPSSGQFSGDFSLSDSNGAVTIN